MALVLHDSRAVQTTRISFSKDLGLLVAYSLELSKRGSSRWPRGLSTRG